MDSFTVQTNDGEITTDLMTEDLSLAEEASASKIFGLICLTETSESFDLASGQNEEILPGLILKVNEQGNGILELTQPSELDVKISGKRVAEVAQFQGNDLISIGKKDFLLTAKEGAVISPDAFELEIDNDEHADEEKIEFDNGFEIKPSHAQYTNDKHKNESLEVEGEGRSDSNRYAENKQCRKRNIFSLFVYGMTCMIIASFGFLLFMNSKISDFNRMAEMANIFQHKMARLLNRKPKVVVKPIQIQMEQIIEEVPSPAPQPEETTIKKKRRSSSNSNSSSLAPKTDRAEKSKKKPSMTLGQKDRERVFKEIEMLKLEYKLDPFNVRKSLQEMRDSISDLSLRRKIDMVLQKL
ncbi:MAG: hypothetical protein HYV97_18310 [Bdellovibrio sp.]|nr:hypothetical protein [Bdellovibrio sp.]